MIQYNNPKTFVKYLYLQYDIKEILLEDVSGYDIELPPQIYFINTNDNMIAYWNLSSKEGVIRTERKGSQWSKRLRKFKKISKKELFKLLEI